ncbi:MAG: hypothetical protein ACOY7U_06940 [Acidobacteriota bacterium]
MYRRVLLRGTVFLGVLIAIACASSTPTATYSPVFDYTPPAGTAPASRSLTFALVGAQYRSPVQFFQRFGAKMASDLQEILAARGYTVRGPFRTYDEMTFPDKKGSDLVLQPELEITADLAGIRQKVTGGAVALALLGEATSAYDGTVTIGGRVNLVVLEPLTRERMWAKSVEISRVTVELNGEALYKAPPSLDELLANEPSFAAEFGRALEQVYRSVMDKAFTYLDPEEMELVNKQAEEIRKKKVY